MPGTYSVSYRRFGSAMWSSTFADVVADGAVPETGHRFFVTGTGERYEIPTNDVEFVFSKERAELIAEQMQAEARRNAEARSAPIDINVKAVRDGS